jgi:hypothetical protein
VSGSCSTELRQPGANAPPGRQEVGPPGARAPGCVIAPDLVAWISPRHDSGIEQERDRRDQATGLPTCRAATELRPLATARSRRFDEPAWGTHEYLGRGAVGPQAFGQGKRSGAFDPIELFGAAWWLTPLRDTVAAQATGATPLVPRVTIQEAYPSFRGKFFSLDFRGHRVVRRDHPPRPRPAGPTPADRPRPRANQVR